MKNNILSISIVDKIIGMAPYMCEGDFADRIRYAHDLGFTGVEINIADPAKLDLSIIRAALEETGMKIVAFGTGRAYVNDKVSLTDPDPDCRANAMKRLRQFIDFASEFGSFVILGCIRGNVGPGQTLTEVESVLGEAMRELESYAIPKGVTMIFEPINRYENNFLCNVADTSEFIHRENLKGTKILMDTFHMNIEDPDLKETILKYGKDVAYVHIADSNRFEPGLGHTDFRTIFNTLNDIGFEGPFDAECRTPGDFTQGCKNWIASVKEYLS